MFMEVKLLVENDRPEIELNSVGFARTKPFVVVGIPAFNEESSIARVVVEAQKVADAVIVCDDGSTDLTAEIALQLGVDVVKHEGNLGYGSAIRSLFKRAREFNADVLVTLDADGQHDPAEISMVVQPIIAGTADVVIGSRFVGDLRKNDMPLYRQFGTKLITRMVNGSAKNGVSDAQSGFRAYSREALKRLSVVEDGMGASVEILLDAAKHGLRIFEVPTSCKYNTGPNASSRNPVSHGLGVLVSFVRLIVEEKPLTFLGIPGLIVLFAGIAFGVWMLQIYAVNHVIETNVALASIGLVLVSFFMLSSAITLYAISRVYKRINGQNERTPERK
jgi:glycosyltransferase involved in cell wall biosynthesis